ncbi:MAG: HAD family hydrolase, partial [Clostridium sp.]
MTKVKIKALAIDLDGTLLNSDGLISDENLEALKLLIENNIEVIPVTGRPYMLVKNVFEKHDLKINHVICSNGGVTYDGSGNKVSSFYMDKEPGVKMLAYLEENNFPYAIFTDKRI